jgi:hypothetical protein
MPWGYNSMRSSTCVRRGLREVRGVTAEENDLPPRSGADPPCTGHPRPGDGGTPGGRRGGAGVQYGLRHGHADPQDPFDFYLDNYVDQLVAGYSLTRPDLSLMAYMPDFGDPAPVQLSRPSP